MSKVENQKDYQKFLNNYSVWLALSFNTSKASSDAVYKLRYDLYELDANYAGVWIGFVKSGFETIDHQINNVQINTLLSRAVELRGSLNDNDATIVDSYIEYLHFIANLYFNYKKIIESK